MKINIIGDSFTMPTNPADIPNGQTMKDTYWGEVLKANYPEAKVLIDGAPSRNVQSVLDHWIKLLPTLGADDLLIICLPFFGRTRLPKKSPMTVFDEDRNPIYEDRFIGTRSYTQKEYCAIEHWGTEIDPDVIYSMLTPQEIVNSSDASCLNNIELVTALKKLTPCKNYVFCWDYVKFENDVIEDRTTLTENIGYWESLHDLYEKTNGVEGMRGNLHWSFPYNIVFGKYLLSKFV